MPNNKSTKPTLSERIAYIDNLLENVTVSGQSVIALAQARIGLKQVFDIMVAEETLKKEMDKPQEKNNA